MTSIPTSANAPTTSATLVTVGPKALHEQEVKTGLPATRNRRRQKAHGARFGSTWPGKGHCAENEVMITKR